MLLSKKSELHKNFEKSFAQINGEGYAYSKDNNILEVIV